MVKLGSRAHEAGSGRFVLCASRRRVCRSAVREFPLTTTTLFRPVSLTFLFIYLLPLLLRLLFLVPSLALQSRVGSGRVALPSALLSPWAPFIIALLHGSCSMLMPPTRIPFKHYVCISMAGLRLGVCITFSLGLGCGALPLSCSRLSTLHSSPLTSLLRARYRIQDV